MCLLKKYSGVDVEVTHHLASLGKRSLSFLFVEWERPVLEHVE